MSVFRFKQFSVRQEKAAMKVGTDGVLLGAWAPLDRHTERILDIGAGTGLISLMMAQRSPEAYVEAVEVDPDSFEECVANFEASPWADRLFCYHCGFDEFAAEVDDRYDLILSNPPFHKEDVPSGVPSRDRARRSGSLPPEMLLQGMAGLLAPGGVCCVVWPCREEAAFLGQAAQFGLYPRHITRVRGTAGAPLKRSLIALAAAEGRPQEDTLVLELERHRYSEAFSELVRDFYLRA